MTEAHARFNSSRHATRSPSHKPISGRSISDYCYDLSGSVAKRANAAALSFKASGIEEDSMTYRAPVADIAFTLNQIAGFPQIIERGLFEDLDMDTARAILE